MLLKEDASEEKLNGRYFTPDLLADYVTEWVLNQENDIDSLLEPSVGDGVFLQSIEKNIGLNENVNAIAIEIDEDVSKSAANRCDKYKWIKGWDGKLNQGRKIINDDFYSAYKNGLESMKFQAIVGNPPYIRYQYLEESQRDEQNLILIKNGMSSNKLINAWVSFTVACVSCLDDNSKIGFVIPAELLQVKYSEDLRKFLVDKLNRITIVTFRSLVFEGIEQEVVLLLGEKISGDNRHEIRIVQFDDLEELQNSNLEEKEFFAADIESTKWTKYFLEDQQLEIIQMVENDPRFVRFSKIAKCEVGITTGNNDFFCVDNATVQEYDLQKFCRPLIARSVNIKGAQFTSEDWLENIVSGSRTYLLDLTPYEKKNFTKGLMRYIAYGVENAQNTTYKCRIRDEWYKVPSVWAPDAFFLRRNYLYPKFMLNSSEVEAVSTDTMHRVRFKTDINRKCAVVGYYTSVSLLFAELEGRSYGGGVLEILPGELGHILLPNIFENGVISEEEIESLFNYIDQYIRTNEDILELLDVVDKEILVNKLGLDMKEVLLLRNAWLRLRSRRLLRGGKNI